MSTCPTCRAHSRSIDRINAKAKAAVTLSGLTLVVEVVHVIAMWGSR